MIELTEKLVRDMFTLDSLYDAGWDDESLVAHGLARKVPKEVAVTVRVDATDARQAISDFLGCSNITSQLVSQTIERDALGQQKYGTTLDRTDLSLTDWLQHQAEELMDGAGYALAAKREAERLLAIEAAARRLVGPGGKYAGTVNDYRQAWDALAASL